MSSRVGWSGARARQALRRRNIVAVVLLTVFIVFSGRLVQLQALEAPRLAGEALDSRLRTYTIQAARGEIVDVNGEVLATSVQRYNIGVNQQKVATFRHIVTDDDGEKVVLGTGAEAAADLLAPLLGRDPAELGAQMVGESTFVYLAKGLTPTEWREIRALGIPGIEPESVTDRLYPNGNTAGNILGFVKRDGSDLVGNAGVELRFDEALHGVNGRETVEIGNGGQVIPTGTQEVTEGEPGDTIRLTIDRDVQYVAQQAVDETVARYGAQWAGVALMEVGSGRLVAFADSGSVDPGNVTATPERARGARTVSAPYEPGSTGKLLTIAAAVDRGVVEPLTTFTVPERMTIDGQTFSDHEPGHPTQDMTVAGILATSSNVGTVQIGNLMEDAERHDYMQAFGFGSRSGIELPGESSGILHEPDDWDGRTRMTTMFGQGYAVTLAQNVAMVATLGNGGVYVPPTLIDSVEHADGSVTVPERPDGRPVISEDAAATMIAMMEGVVQEGGTAPRARIDGYRVAGKTGTAQTADGAGGLSATVANFVGIVPADQPRYAVAVVVYKPTSGFFGGTIAAPIFKDVAEFALHNAGVRPSTGSPTTFPWIIE